MKSNEDNIKLISLLISDIKNEPQHGWSFPIDFLENLQERINIHGYSVSLEQVENTLLALTGLVRECDMCDEISLVEGTDEDGDNTECLHCYKGTSRVYYKPLPTTKY